MIDIPTKDQILERTTHLWMESDLAQKWLHSPIPALDERRPIDLVETEAGRRELLPILERLEIGDFP
jgi:putative toxin-antitoxin system antitoxin component (TIGR02293 family)